jgi:hypothetical protein
MCVTSRNKESKASMLRGVIDCILDKTHDPRVPDWTPAQMAFWFSRVQASDVEQVLAIEDTDTLMPGDGSSHVAA